MAQQPFFSSSNFSSTLSKVITSKESPELLKELLIKLTADLQETKPNKDTIEVRLIVLAQYCNLLSISGWQEFLPLVPLCMRQCLPERNLLYAHYQFQREAKTLAQGKYLLQQYQHIAAQAKNRVSKQQYQEFERQAYHALVEKGYYRPEAWLGAIVLGVEQVADSSFDEHKAQERCQNNPRLKNYYEEFVRHLSACMQAAVAIFSGQINPVLNLKQTMTASILGEGATLVMAQTGFATLVQESLPALLSGIPIGGGIASCLTTLIQKGYEYSQKLMLQGNAARVCAWSLTSLEASQLAKELGLRLSLVRDSFSTSFQECKEDKELNSAKMLALKDCDAMLGLLQNHRPNTSHWSGSSAWLKGNAEFLIAQFQEDFIPAAKKISINPTTTTIKAPPLDLPGKNFFHNVSLFGMDRSHHRLLREVQFYEDSRIQCQSDWAKLWVSLDKTQLESLFNFQTKIIEQLVVPYFKWGDQRTEMIDQYLRPLWSTEVGLAVITQAVTKASQQDWSAWKDTHQTLQTTVKSLSEQNLELAWLVDRHYRAQLGKWQVELEKNERQQTAELKKLTAEEKILDQRGKNWRDGFQQKGKELNVDFKAQLAPQLLSLKEKKETYADPERFAQQALMAWKQEKSFSYFAQQCLSFEAAWKNSRNQDRPVLDKNRKIRGSIAQGLHASLALAYQKAQQTVTAEINAARYSITERREKLKQEQDQCKANLNALTQELTRQIITEEKSKRIQSISSSPIASTQPKEKKSDFSKKPFSERVIEFWRLVTKKMQKLEKKVGIAPCGFSVIVWSEGCPGLIMDKWRYGIFLTNFKCSNAKYWLWYADFLKEHLLELTQAMLLPIEFDSIPGYVITQENFFPYQQFARCLMVSETQAEQAQNLWPEYQKHCAAQLSVAPREIKSSLNRFVRASEESELGGKVCNPLDSLLRPLLLCLYDMAHYYNVPPDIPEKLLAQFQEQGYVHPDFITDFRAAYCWALTHAENLQDAWLNDQPDGLKSGQALLVEEFQIMPKNFSSVFCLSSQEYDHHHRYTVEVLQQIWINTYASKHPSVNLTQKFDPLSFYCQSLLTQAATAEFYDTHVSCLDNVQKAMVHRPALKKASWQVDLFLNLTESSQLYYLKILTTHLAIEEQGAPDGLIYRLKHAPSRSGRRARWAEEQIEWRERILPKLWLDDKTAKDTADSGEEKCARSASISTKTRSSTTIPEIKISVVRQIQRQGQWVWEVESHILKPNIANKLFDFQGKWRPKDKKYRGNHRVFPIGAGGKFFWIKAYPEQPAMEWIVQQLDRRLGVFGTPRFEVVKFHHGEQTSCALITEHVKGHSLNHILNEEPDRLNDVSFSSFARTLLRVLLTNPEDDKDDDYILETQPGGSLYLKRIDNERAFFEPFKEETTGTFILTKKNTLQVKSVVYCLEQMGQIWPKTDPAIQNLLAEWQKIRATSLMQDLLQQAMQQRAAWCTLFSWDEVEQHFQLAAPEKGIAVMFIPQGLTKEIITRLSIIKNSLRLAAYAPEGEETEESGVYSLTGLSLLQETQPKLAQYYKKYWQTLSVEAPKSSEVKPEHRRSRQRFKDAVIPWYQKNEQGGSSSGIVNEKAIQTTFRLKAPLTLEQLKMTWKGEAYSPEQELEELKKWSKERCETIARDLLRNNDSCSTEDENRLWPVVEEFRALPERQRNTMWLGFREKLRAKQVNTRRQNILLLAMTGAGWQSLDLSAFSSQLITKERLEPLLKGDPGVSDSVSLKKINISGCDFLTEEILGSIQIFSKDTLQALYCNRMQWASVILKNWEELIRFECAENKKFTYFSFDNVPKLQFLNLENNPELTTLSGFAPQLTHLTLRNCSKLRCIGERGTLINTPLSTYKLRHLNIKNCVNIEELCLPDSVFFRVFVQHLNCCPKLRVIELEVKGGWINVPDFLFPFFRARNASLDFSYENRLTLEQVKSLASYLPYDRYFTHLDFSNNEWDNSTIAILMQGVGQNKFLTHVNLSGNKITAAGAEAIAAMLRNNRSLTSLDLWGNDIGWSGVDVIISAMQSNNTLLEFRHHYACYIIEKWNKYKNEWEGDGECVKRIGRAEEVKDFSTPKKHSVDFSYRSPSLVTEIVSPQRSDSISNLTSPLAFFFRDDSKRSESFMEEKSKLKLKNPQTKLILACEKGNIAEVKKALAQGAQVNQADDNEKIPLYAAVYGMSPRIVSHLISCMPIDEADKPNISWLACIVHNAKYYGQLFSNMNFTPKTFGEWYALMAQIENNGFLSGYHLVQIRRIYGEDDVYSESFSMLKTYEKIKVNGKTCFRNGPRVIDGGDVPEYFLPTERGYEAARTQIKQEIELLEARQEKQFQLAG